MAIVSNKIKAIEPETATGETKELLEAVKSQFGFVPNTFKVMANSPETLAAFLGFMTKMEGGSLPFETRNEIAIAVSELNKCSYCLSAFTAIGKSAGLSESDLTQCRLAGSTDPKIDAAIKLAQGIVKERGNVSEELLSRAHEVGYTDAEIEEIVANVALITFINYINIVGKTEVDFPLIMPHQK